MSDDPASATSRGASTGFDVFDVVRESRASRPLIGTITPALRSSLGLVFGAGRGVAVLTFSLQLLVAVLSGVQVLVGERLLHAVLAVGARRAGLNSSVVPVSVLAGATAVSLVAASLLVQQQRLLNELVQRAALRRLLDVAAAVDLTAFERSDFYDRLLRVRQNALHKPIVLTQGLVALAGGLVGAAVLVAAIATLAPLLLPVLALSAVPLFLVQRRGSRMEFGFIVDQTTPTRERWYLQRTILDRDAAKELRAFSLGPVLLTRFNASYDRYLAGLRTMLRRRTLMAVGASVSTAAVITAALFLLLRLVSRGELSVAAAGAAVVSVPLLAGRLQQLATGAGGVYESSLFLRDLDEFLALKPAAEHARSSRPASPGFPGVVLDRVSFSYPGSTREALSDVSLRIAPGEVVALVGENGSGKTTLAKLLAALYQPTAGQVLWGGVDASHYDPESLRQNIAVIFQDFFKYQLPAQTNIGVGRPEAMDDLEAIVAAACQAEAHGFLASLPLGYDTFLSNQFRDGRDLSVGQWQRVALARAFFRDAPFVILDEPTSALDPRAEQAIFDQVRTLLAGRTVLLVSHRFSGVRSADRIVAMRAGQIVEEGTHDELMRAGGLYAELFNLQASAYAPEAPLP